MPFPRPRPAFWFIAPALVLSGVFFLLPVLAGLALSLTDFDLYALGHPEHLRFVGLDNYRLLLADPSLWMALGNTLVFVLGGGAISIVVSLGAALLLTHPRACWQGFFRSALFLPVTTTLVAVAVVWRTLYHPRYGLFNAGLMALGLEPVDWLGDADWAMPSIIALSVWKNFGFNMLIFCAGLESIPVSLYEAARLDGARGITTFRYITLPQLAPTFLFVAITTAIGSFQLFAEPYVMTQGGPSDATLSLALLMYREGFRWWNIGQASSLAVLLCFTLLGLGLLGRPGRRRG